MTIIPDKPKTEQPTATLPSSEVEQQFNWKNCWYPVTFLKDLPNNRPYSFSLYDEPLVIFRNQEGKLVCLSDRCPHRAAKLSDGQVIDGKIECLYHGWQFGNDGECLRIPQLPEDAKIPANSCVQSYPIVERQGIVWMWRGKAELADKKDIPTVADFDNPTIVSSDYMIDLPYDQTFFIENALDPSHLFISHNGTLKWRKYVQPLKMEIIEVSSQGIQGRYCHTKGPNQNWISLNFIAPNLVTYRRSSSNPILGSALYSLPLGKGRCRIIIRNYKNISAWKLKLQPRWFEHWYRNKFLEEDLPLVVGQQTQVNCLEKSLKELYLPLKTSDLVLIEYRKWLDKYGSLLPFYQGYKTSHNIDKHSVEIGTRLTRHTQICGSCSQAYEVTKKVKQSLVGVAIGMAVLAILTDGSWIEIFSVSASLLAVILAVLAGKVKTKFERSYTRK
ncbi:MAG: Rieske 2Fe-2S domain-containing protein [Moorea sp. SIO2B7]|nr:Rieske 2Fe-2S domain-containing protein [Moorena sp. SIO2B7]